ncbi:hypothetical protein GPECTOR_20g523 [Gonium pectorale]|uniref:AB hydrolase-1 domain-containing protein n=1 Tax=Gonium pectorale TaxID=33097 RepID=A0A150GIM5_GONPE|nr:hypothetical protein GPECTOR_20g523 [Gonium pectorale]|eukprot:KXZ49666.1 hypothetical protein GPECTOR_20g523 [Gonium pectorale]
MRAHDTRQRAGRAAESVTLTDARTAAAPLQTAAATAPSLSAASAVGPAAAAAASAASASASRSDLNAALVKALVEQFQRESLPWIQDLVEPLLAGPPQPLTGTSPPEQLADPDSRFATVSGLRLHYKLRQPGEWADASAPERVGWRWAELQREAAEGAPTLLLLHGLNGSTFSWRLLMDDLAAYVSPLTGGCRVVAYDRPPYGLSQRPLGWPREQDNPYGLEGAARLTVGLLDEVTRGSRAGAGPATAAAGGGAEAAGGRGGGAAPAAAAAAGGGGGSGQAANPSRAVLVGHSAGAAVAVETALRYPDRVSGLVLVAPAIATDSRGFLARADLGQLLRFAWTRSLLSADGPGLNYVRRQVLRRVSEVEAGRLGVYSDEREVPQEVIDGYLRPLRAHDWDYGTLQAYRSFQVGGSPPPLERLRMPVLVVAGRQDGAVPLEAVQRVEAALRRRSGPGCVTESVVLDPCGHVPMDERPLETLQAIVDFVNRHCL